MDTKPARDPHPNGRNWPHTTSSQTDLRRREYDRRRRIGPPNGWPSPPLLPLGFVLAVGGMIVAVIVLVVLVFTVVDAF